MKTLYQHLFSVLMIFAALSLSSCERSPVPEKIESIRIGVFADSISALLYVARDKGMFKRHGLEVSIDNYQAGAYAVSDLLASKVDVATATGFVLALQGFKRKDLRAIGTISSSDSIEVIARGDRRIGNPADLKGKLIGVSKGTANDFFLSVFLSLNGIRPGEVRTIDLKPVDTVSAISDGTIDAAICFPPFSDDIKKKLVHKVVSWPAQAGQEYHFLLITTENLIKTRPRIATGLLKGVIEAEDFVKSHETEAQGIIERTLGLDHEAVLKTWSKTHFRVRLDQALLTMMEDEARWAIKNKVVDGKKVPNYLPYLYLEGLDKLKPDAVGVVR